MYLPAIIALLAFTVVGCKKPPVAYADQPAKKDFFAVTAREGLNLRAEPDMKSRRLATLPFGHRGPITQRSAKFEKLQKANGFWFQTKYQNHTGWVFSGFAWLLTTLDEEIPVRHGTSAENELKHYLEMERLELLPGFNPRSFDRLPHENVLGGKFGIFLEKRDLKNPDQHCSQSKLVIFDPVTKKAHSVEVDREDFRLHVPFATSKNFLAYTAIVRNCTCAQHRMISVIFADKEGFQRLTTNELDRLEREQSCAIIDSEPFTHNRLRYDPGSQHMYVHIRKPICNYRGEMFADAPHSFEGHFWAFSFEDGFKTLDEFDSIDLPLPYLVKWNAALPAF